jgi:hypothetical protein
MRIKSKEDRRLNTEDGSLITCGTAKAQRRNEDSRLNTEDGSLNTCSTAKTKIRKEIKLQKI